MKTPWWLAAVAMILTVMLIIFLLSPPQAQIQSPISNETGKNLTQANKSQEKANISLNNSKPTILTVNTTQNVTAPAGAKTLKLASWNLQIFGTGKAGNATLMAIYAGVMKQYDIIFIQEIRDASGTAFPRLCALMAGYQCLNSSRAGRNSSKEQYGVIYKGVDVVGTKDYNPESQGSWERPPFQVSFRQDDYLFSALVEHIKPDDARNEIARLSALAANITGNVVVLGDLNADCAYYRAQDGANGTGADGANNADFTAWTWAISSRADTSVANASCAYDRIIFNPDMAREYARAGVYSQNITRDVSDHYLVWSEVRMEENE